MAVVCQVVFMNEHEFRHKHRSNHKKEDGFEGAFKRIFHKVHNLAVGHQVHEREEGGGEEEVEYLREVEAGLVVTAITYHDPPIHDEEYCKPQPNLHQPHTS